MSDRTASPNTYCEKHGVNLVQAGRCALCERGVEPLTSKQVRDHIQVWLEEGCACHLITRLEGEASAPACIYCQALGEFKRLRAAVETSEPPYTVDSLMDRLWDIYCAATELPPRIDYIIDRSSGFAPAPRSPSETSERRYAVGDPCGRCASGSISERGGHRGCNNCGWNPPGSWTEPTKEG